MRFDSRDLTVKLTASPQGGDCGGCTDTQAHPPQPPGCRGCTDTRKDQGDCECDPCTNTASLDQPTGGCKDDDEKDHGRQSLAALTALRQQLREALSQAG